MSHPSVSYTIGILQAHPARDVGVHAWSHVRWSTRTRSPFLTTHTQPRALVLTVTDIWGANMYGWNSILLRTGVYAGGEPAHAPTFIADDVELAVEWAIKRELANAGKAA